HNNISPNFISVPLGKASILDGLNYVDWVNKLKLHLIALHPSLWEVVNVGVRMPKSDDEVSPEMMLDLHHNAQAASIILASLSQKLDDHKVARQIIRAYQFKNMGLAQMIRDHDYNDEMKPHTRLGKLQQHEMADQAAIKAAERVSNAMVPNVSGTSKRSGSPS